VLARAGHDTAAVDENSGNIEAGERHEATRHVLVAATDGHNSVVVHARGNHLDGISDDFAADQGVPHPLMAHHDAIRGGGGPVDLGNPATGTNTLDRLAGKPVEMRVAGCDVGKQAGHAHHGTAEILLDKTDRPQHGTVGSAAWAAGCHEALSFLHGR